MMWRKLLIRLKDLCKQMPFPILLLLLLYIRNFPNSLNRFLIFMNKVLVLYSMRSISRSFSSKFLSFSSHHLQFRQLRSL